MSRIVSKVYSSIIPIKISKNRSSGPFVTHHDYRVGNKIVWVNKKLVAVAMFPERVWRYILCRLWLDRLTFQYERGYAAGLREALDNYETYKHLTPEELAGVLAEPPHEEY